MNLLLKESTTTAKYLLCSLSILLIYIYVDVNMYKGETLMTMLHAKLMK